MTEPIRPTDVPCDFCGAKVGEACRPTTRRQVDGSYRVWKAPANVGHLSWIRDSKQEKGQSGHGGPRVIASESERGIDNGIRS